MIPILFDSNLSLTDVIADDSFGLGEIIDAFDGVAIEEANGPKEMYFKVPMDSPRFSDLKTGSFIKIKSDDYHSDNQLYIVYQITKPINGIVTVYAEHVSYLLGKATVTPFTETGIIPVKNKMISNLVGSFPFDFQTDIVNTQSVFSLKTPMSFRKCLGGFEGSVLDVFGGELDWDNLTVKLFAHRGQDRGVRIEYGKNLTDLNQEESIANVYDAVIGYAVINERTHVGDIQKITVTNSPRTLNVDFSSSFESGEELTDNEIKTRLNSLASSYATNNNIGVPKVNLKVSFEPLQKYAEYADLTLLEQTRLFDTVHVFFQKLGIEATAKVIKTQYDFINEKYISIELGNAKTNFTDLINEQIESQVSDFDVDIRKIGDTIGFLDKYVENFSNIITNGLGLFFTKVPLADGSYQYYLHDKPVLANSLNRWTINQGGFAVSTDGGQTWTAGIDAQGNAILNSLSTITLRALEIYGSYIEGSQILFGDSSNKYILAQTYNDGTNDIGITFDGTGTVRFQPQEKFIVNNLDGNSNPYNNITMQYVSGLTQFFLINYNHTTNIAANSISLTSQDNQRRNDLMLTNNAPGDSYYNNYYNYIDLQASGTGASISLVCPKFNNGTFSVESSSITLESNQTIRIGVSTLDSGSQTLARQRDYILINGSEHQILLYSTYEGSIYIPRIYVNGSDGTIKLYGSGLYFNDVKIY